MTAEKEGADPVKPAPEQHDAPGTLLSREDARARTKQVIDRLAAIHDASVAAGTAYLAGDLSAALDQLDRVTDAAIAAATRLRELEQEMTS